jgi:hypothetical protein
LRIFTKKAFKFQDHESGESVKTLPFSFSNVPIWATKDVLFAWGVKDGDIEVVQSKSDEREIEKSDVKMANNNGNPDNDKDSVDKKSPKK